MTGSMLAGAGIKVRGVPKNRECVRIRSQQLRTQLVARGFKMDVFDDSWENPEYFGFFTCEPSLIDYFVDFAREELGRTTLSIRVTSRFLRVEFLQQIGEALGMKLSSYRDLTKVMRSQDYAVIVTCDKGAHVNSDAYSFFTWVRALAADSEAKVKAALLLAPEDVFAEIGSGGGGGLRARMSNFFPSR